MDMLIIVAGVAVGVACVASLMVVVVAGINALIDKMD